MKNNKKKLLRFSSLLSIISIFLWGGCSGPFVLKSSSPSLENTVTEPPSSKQDEPLSENTFFKDSKPEALLFSVSKTTPQIEWKEEIKNKIESFEIKLSEGSVLFTNEVPKKTNSEITLELLTSQSSGDSCQAQMRIQDGKVEIIDSEFESEKKNSSLKTKKCIYQLTLRKVHATAIDLKLLRGNIEAKGWQNKIKLDLQWGEIDLSQVGELKVQCGSCNLTGESVFGPVTYKIENGNVGLEGLEESVQGETNGDTVLIWKKVSRNVKINIKSNNGDVALDFPSHARLAPQVHAKHGDVIYQIGKNMADGIPVSVNSTLGNIKLYQAGYRTR